MPFNKPIEKRYFTITEVANELGLNASQLRYWEKEFTSLNPRTNARGKRFYSAADKELIQQIAWLVKDQGYTIDGARKALRKRNEVAEAMAQETAHRAAPVAKPDAVPQAMPSIDREVLLSRLRGVKAKLEELQARLSD